MNNALSAGPIRQGAYSFQARAGKKRVEITATRPDPKARTAMGPTYVDYIPERYNVHSTLSVEVTPDGKKQFDFPLKSREPRTRMEQEIAIVEGTPGR